MLVLAFAMVTAQMKSQLRRKKQGPDRACQMRGASAWATWHSAVSSWTSRPALGQWSCRGSALLHGLPADSYSKVACLATMLEAGPGRLVLFAGQRGADEEVYPLAEEYIGLAGPDEWGNAAVRSTTPRAQCLARLACPAPSLRATCLGRLSVFLWNMARHAE